MISFNKLICSPYTGGKGVNSIVTKGFASVKRKELVGLKVLVDAKILLGTNIVEIKKGQTVYISEENLTINNNYTHAMESEAIEGSFVIAEPNHVVLIK